MTSRFAMLIVVATVACGGSSPTGGGNPPPPPPPAGGPASTITIGDNAYGSANVSVVAGTTVRWENGGLVAHTATSSGGVWDSGNLTPGYTQGGYFYTGGSYQRSFNTPGTYPYSCTYHAAQGMQGTITVTP